MNSKCSICGKFGEVAAYAGRATEICCFPCLDWVRRISDKLIDKVLYRK